MEFFWQTADYMRQGGWVMAPLVVVSVVMWTLILDRLRAYAQLRRSDLTRDEALAAVASGNAPPGTSLRAVFLRDYLAARSGVRHLDELALQVCSLRSRRRLDHGLALVAVLAVVAPLLGLLGTVLGMIETFEVISIFGTGNSRALASGISVALITTQTGLLVAIPGLLMSNRLSRTATHLKTNLDELTALLMRQIGGDDPDGLSGKGSIS